MKTAISEGWANRLAMFEEMKEKTLTDEKNREVLKRWAEIVSEEKINYEV